MSISSISIKRPVMTIVVSIIIVLFGFIGYSNLGVREFPSIDPPVITVNTSYSGANSDVIESQITEPLEQSLNGIAGIRSITSASNQGTSSITVEFNLDADLESAANDVRDRVSRTLKQLPADITAPPTVTKSDANSDAIIALTIQSDTKNQLQISYYAANVLQEKLQTIPGVSNIQIWGEKKYAMRLWMDPNKLASYGLTPLDVSAALNRENIELPAGKIAGNTTELTIRTNGKLRSEEEFNRMIILEKDEKIVRLEDIGIAKLGAENEETILKQTGVPMIGLGLVPQPGANYLDIAKEFYKRYAQLKKDLPAEYHMDIALDNTSFVKKSIKEVEETLFIAFLLVVLVIYLFFRDWLIAFRPLIDIPISLIGTFFIMYLAGFSINVLTLLAIVLATGLVVDDGIVVTENIYKKIEKGMSPLEAALKGSAAIYFAVISTSLTLAIVFLPVIFLQGFTGRLFREFGVVMASAVLISAFVSLTLTPVLNVMLSRKKPKHSKFYTQTEPFFEGMTNAYKNSLQTFMKRRWVAFIIVASCIYIIFGLGSKLQKELAPLDDRNFLRLVISAPEGSSFEYTDQFIDQLTQFFSDSIPEKQVILSVVAPGFSGSGAVNTGFARIVLKDPGQRKKSQQDIADYVNAKSKKFPGAKVFAIQEQTIAVGGGRMGLPLQYVLQASSFEKLQEYLPKFLEEANKNPTFQVVDVNLKFNKPELKIEIDRERARSLGVSASALAQTLQMAYSGQRFGYFFMNNKQFPVMGQVQRENRDAPIDLQTLYVKNNDGKLIQLDNIIRIKEQSNPPQLYHFNRYKSATISAGLANGKTIGDGIKAMDAISKKVLDSSFSTDLTGPSRDYSESSSNILFAFLLALLLIYLILSAQFESFIDSIVIMITVPLAIAGAILSLWYFNQTLNIFSEIGIIMLIGLVTKNGILIVEFANRKKAEGMMLREAVIEAATARLRPILMTTMATALGALPIALSLGAGAKSRISMGIVIIAGLLFSLVLTLYVIPAMYSYLSKNPKRLIKENAIDNPIQSE